MRYVAAIVAGLAAVFSKPIAAAVGAGALLSVSVAPAVTPPPATGNTITITNVSGSTVSNYPLQRGRPFLDGVIPKGSVQTTVTGTIAVSNSVATLIVTSGSGIAAGQILTWSGQTTPAPLVVSGAGSTWTLSNSIGSLASPTTITASAQQCPQTLINGTPATSQADVKNYYPDGSVEFAIIAVVIPTLPTTGSTTLTFQPAACNNTALTSAAMLSSTYNWDAQIGFQGLAYVVGGNPTTTLATWQAVTNGGFCVTVNGTPECYSGMNFSAITALNQIAPIVQQSIGLQGASGPAPPTLYYAYEMYNKFGTHTAGQNYILSSPTAGAGSSMSFATAPSGGVTDISTMLGLTSAAGAAIVPGTPVNIANSSITAVSARAMLTAGFCTPWTQGPVAQTMACADDTTARTYDVGFGDGYHPLRPRFYATFWPATGQVFTRFVGEQAATTEIEDLRYYLTLCTGYPVCTQVYQNDLTGTGNAIGEAITGISLSASYPATHAGLINFTGSPSSPIPGNGSVQINNNWMNYCSNGVTGCPTTASNQLYIGCPSVMTDCSTSPPLTSGQPILVGSPNLQWGGTTWTKTYWEGGTPADQINVDANLPYLEFTRFIPNFDTSIVLSPSFITSTYASYLATLRDMFTSTANQVVGSGTLWLAHQNGSGAQYGIGPYPYADVDCLFAHGDYRMCDWMKTNNDIASFYGFGIRETQTGKRMSRADTPGSSTGFGHAMSVTDRKTVLTYDQEYNYSGTSAGDRVLFVGQYDQQHPFGFDTEHEPEPYFVPYVLLGDPFYLQELYMWAAYSEAATADNQRGPTGDEGVIAAIPRVVAWVMRNRGETAFIAPDGAPEKSYFAYLLNDQIADFEGGYHITGTPFTGTFMELWADGKLPGGPTNPTNPDYGSPPPTGGLDVNYCDPMVNPVCEDVSLETDGSGSQQWAVGAVGSFFSDFMESYVDYSFGRLRDLGWAISPIASKHSQLQIGLVNINPVLTQAEWSAAETWNGQSPPVHYFDTTANPTEFLNAFESGFIAATTIAFHNATGDGESYPAYATAALSFTNVYTNGASAWSSLNTAMGVPCKTTYYSICAGVDPRWMLIPRTDTNVLPAQPTTIPPS